MRDRVLILGAGAPHRGDQPAVLWEAQAGTAVLDWVLGALEARRQDVTFVAGYQAEAVRSHYPDLPVLENPDWRETGSGASLLTVPPPYAPDNDAAGWTVAYGDILLRSDLVRRLRAVDAPVAVAWDSHWRRRYAGRSADDLAGCEKVAVHDGRAVRLGADLPVDWADGEFIGLVRLAPEALHYLEALRERLPESLRTVHLSGLIEYLRSVGFDVGAVDVAGDWAEVNEPRDIAHFILGTKAETLARLHGMVRHATIQDQVAFTVAQWRAEADVVLERVRERLGGQRLVVRSSARSEDSFTSANAGAYDSVLHVDPERDLNDAITRVIASFGEADTDDQVLVQPMVADVSMSGVAFTRTLERGAPWRVINYETDGDTEGITSGEARDHKTLVVRRNAPVTPDTLPEPRLAGLLDALAEIEGLLGYDALDVEFALDTRERVHILQVRPIAVGAQGNGSVGAEGAADDLDAACDHALAEAHAAWQRLAPTPPHLPGDAAPLYGVMPDWNPAEIIGTAPGALADSVYRFLILDEVWATQRAEYGYRDVRPAPLLTGFAGRPYVDVRASFASFIPARVPDELAGRLLTFYLEWLRERPHLHDKVEFDVVPTCLAPDFPGWAGRLREHGFSDDDVATLRDGLHGITRAAFTRNESDLAVIETLSARFDAVAGSALDPLERARILLDDCRRLGTLAFSHLARSGFVAVTLLRAAEATGVITGAARESFLSTVQTVSHTLGADARACAAGELAWDAFVARYGHLRPGTYDITSPRYDADPERFLRPLVEHAARTEPEHGDPAAWHAERDAFFSELARLDLPSDPETVERFLRTAIEGREYAKFIFSRNLSGALDALQAAGEAWGLSAHELADLPLEALLAERDARAPGPVQGHGVHALRERARAGHAARTLASACELPPLLTRESDLDAFVLGADRPNFIGSDAVTAERVDLAAVEGDTVPAIEGRIVLIPRADPGYDWLFGQGIAGLVTLYGGANSHMAIRAAEFGLPAAIGVGEQRYRELAQAPLIELAPANGILRGVR